MSTVQTSREPIPVLSDAASAKLGTQLGSRWQVGDRLPPVRELALSLDVSVGTAHRAVHDLIRGGFLIARPRLGTFVSTRFSNDQLQAIFNVKATPAAPGDEPMLRQARVTLVHSHESTHLQPAVDLIESELKRGQCLIEHRPSPNIDADGPPIASPDAQLLIVVNPSSLWRVESAGHQHVIIISSLSTLPGLHCPRCDAVVADEEQGASLAGEYLLQRVGPDVCFVGVGALYKLGRPPYDATSNRRLAGLERGLGQAVPEPRRLLAPYYSPLGGARAAVLFAGLQPRPRGVFLASDDLALGFIPALHALGLDLGRDYELVSYDGQEVAQRLAPGGLPSVAVPGTEMGFAALDLIRARQRNPQRPNCRMVMNCSLPVRPSSPSP
jgi:hypothetical protein